MQFLRQLQFTVSMLMVILFCGDKIVVSYTGEDWTHNDGARMLHVFNIAGD